MKIDALPVRLPVPVHVLAGLVAACLASGSMMATALPAQAQDQKTAATAPSAEKPIELTEEEKKERELRKSCKVAICSAFHERKPGADIACNVLKTWRKEQLAKAVGKGGLSWPWGSARCIADIKLKRESLIKAMSEADYVMQVDNHTITCELDRDEKDKYAIKFDIAPKVTFKQGKAVKARLGWGKIEAPTLAKGALWSATATDNTFNVLQGTVLEDINDFVDNKCMEVKDEWKGK